jgi:phosphoribosylformylglycinamidine synthase subunit PurS
VTNPNWQVEVIVMPKDGVSDPQGEAVRGGLGMLGHAGVAKVRVGRHLVLDLDAPPEADARVAVTRMAEQLLANPVIEQFEISAVHRIRPAGVV